MIDESKQIIIDLAGRNWGTVADDCRQFCLALLQFGFDGLLGSDNSDARIASRAIPDWSVEGMDRALPILSRLLRKKRSLPRMRLMYGPREVVADREDVLPWSERRFQRATKLLTRRMKVLAAFVSKFEMLYRTRLRWRLSVGDTELEAAAAAWMVITCGAVLHVGRPELAEGVVEGAEDAIFSGEVAGLPGSLAGLSVAEAWDKVDASRVPESRSALMGLASLKTLQMTVVKLIEESLCTEQDWDDLMALGPCGEEQP